MNGNNYPALAQFLGAYFHQDFMLDYGSPDGAIAAFVADEPPESVHKACNELKQIMPLIEGIDDPEKFLWRVLGCNYLPKADGLTVVEWLRHVHEKLCG